MRQPAIAVLMAVGVLGLVSCGSGANGASPVSQPPASAAVITAAPAPGTLATTTASTTVGAVPAVAVPDHRLVMIGDSLFARSSAALQRAFALTGYELTLHAISGSRWADHTPEIVAAGHERPGALVVELGTNDVLDGDFSDADRESIDRAMAALVGNPCVLFVNVGLVEPNRPGLLTDPQWKTYASQLKAVAESNRYLAGAIDAHPVFHLFDWNQAFNQHPDWSDDLIHVRPSAAEEYAELVVSQVRPACPLTEVP